MFNNVPCTIPQNAMRLTHKGNNQFIRTVLEEERRVKQYRAQEIQSTAENPRIKAQEETIEISKELRKEKRNQFLEEKRRQQLRENNEELRQLQISLRAAYISKTLAEQKAERERLQEEQKLVKRQEDLLLEKERLKCLEKWKEEEQRERLKKQNLRGVLQEQMSQTNAKRMEAYQELMREKEAMDEVVRKIEAEERKEREDLIIRKERAMKEMHEFVRSQELLKQQQRAQKLDENEKFMEILKQRDAEQKGLDDAKRRERERKQALSEKIGQQLFVTENEKRKREILLLDLLVEELKAKEDLRFRQNLEKQFQERIQVRSELEHYRQEILSSKEDQEKEENNRWKEEQMKILAERDKLEQLSNENRRRKLQEHRRVTQQMIEEKKLQRAQEASEVIQEYEMQLNEDKKRTQLIEEERKRLLMDQPSAVLSYLPAGVLRESDREFLSLPPGKSK